jgi:imidazoleglycerol phosphate dehydratase HisB
MDNLPLYIEEMGCILFASEEERSNALRTCGTGKKLVQSYAAGVVPLINATYVAITCLSGKSYYQISGGQIEEIPQDTGEYVDRMIIEHDISRNKMDTHDVFVINTIIRKGKHNNIRETIYKCEIKYIERATIRPGNPIIFSYNGLVIFNEYQDAADFLQTHGTIENYMIALGLAVTKQRQDKQIEDLNRRAKSDKKGMIHVFTLMGGTSICSIFAENIIKCAKEGTDGDETMKRLLKILGIGIVGIGGIIGTYLLYKKYQQIKEEKQKRK